PKLYGFQCTKLSGMHHEQPGRKPCSNQSLLDLCCVFPDASFLYPTLPAAFVALRLADKLAKFGKKSYSEGKGS
ncbi:hypothetical protein U1Q18_019935, partial [Sarracenia purpurea var. burkii]